MSPGLALATAAAAPGLHVLELSEQVASGIVDSLFCTRPSPVRRWVARREGLDPPLVDDVESALGDDRFDRDLEPVDGTRAGRRLDRVTVNGSTEVETGVVVVHRRLLFLPVTLDERVLPNLPEPRPTVWGRGRPTPRNPAAGSQQSRAAGHSVLPGGIDIR